MKVRFLQDYQGQYTGPHYYLMGQVVELNDTTCAHLVEDKRAEYVAAPAAPKKAAPKRKVIRRKRAAPKKS